jgi:hypothetical protein
LRRFSDAPFRRLTTNEREAEMNAPVVMEAHCAVVPVERNAPVERCAARMADCTLGAELCSTDELGRNGAEKRSRRHLMQNHRLPRCPMNLEDLECDLDRRS